MCLPAEVDVLNGVDAMLIICGCGIINNALSFIKMCPLVYEIFLIKDKDKGHSVSPTFWWQVVMMTELN